jgi:hypothetical protein
MDFKEADSRIHEAAGRITAAPLDQQAQRIAEEAKKFPLSYQQTAKTWLGYVVGQARMEVFMEIDKHRKSIRWVGIGFGIVALIACVVLAIVFPKPTAFQYLVFRVTLALAGAGISGGLTGFLEIKSKAGAWSLAAGGGLAVFLLIFKTNPPVLPSPESP